MLMNVDQPHFPFIHLRKRTNFSTKHFHRWNFVLRGKVVYYKL